MSKFTRRSRVTSIEEEPDHAERHREGLARKAALATSDVCNRMVARAAGRPEVPRTTKGGTHMQRIKPLVFTLCLSWPATVVAQPAEAWVQRNFTQLDDVRRPPRVRRVDCDRAPAGKLQETIDSASQGDTIQVRGTCQENVTIPLGKDLITLDGGGGLQSLARIQLGPRLW